MLYTLTSSLLCKKQSPNRFNSSSFCAIRTVDHLAQIAPPDWNRALHYVTRLVKPLRLFRIGLKTYFYGIRLYHLPKTN